ncbi:MAG: tandem-95 repeat protein, partial [Verrucomicrobiales bacterium]|nr:tandem-95 repeat protein [Verrucomicrobiales bacterium]
ESATVTFDYAISDGNGGTDTATVTVTVNGQDDATVTAPDAVATDEETAVTIDVLSNDSDADTSDNPLSIASVTQPSSGSVTNNGTDVTFDPNGQFDSLAVGESATASFTYTTDTGAAENVTVTVNGVNDGPAAADDVATTGQDSPVAIDVLANDSDPDTSDSLIVLGVNQPPKGQVQISGGNQLVFDPSDDFNDLGAGESATVTFDYAIYDGNGGTDTATVTVTVNGADEATVTAPDVGTTDEETAININVLANDSDVDASDNPLTIASVTQPVAGLVTNNGKDVTFNPNGDFEDLAVGESAAVTFTYTTDTGITESVTVTVNGVNDGPGAVDDGASTNEEDAVTIDVLDNDTDPDTSDDLVILGVDQPARGSVSVNSDSEIVFDPEGDFEDLDAGESATVTFDYTISDGNGGTDTATVTVTVNGADDATVAAPDADITDEDTAVTIDVLANDTDVDTSDNPLSVASVTQPTDTDDGTVVNNTTDVTFTPGSNFDSLAVGESATTTFTYTTDTGVTETVTVTVNGVNDGPVANSDSGSTDQDNVTTIDALDNDTDPDVNDTLTVTGVTQPTRGIVTVDASDELVFNPNGEFDYLGAGESATVTFSYDIEDGNGGTDTAVVTVTVTGNDDSLVAVGDSGSTDEDTAVSVDVLANDSDPDTADNPLAIDSFTQPNPGSGSVFQVGDALVFDPGNDFGSLAVGETDVVSFTYTVINQSGASDVETVTITVNGANDAPTAVDDFESTGQNGTANIDLLGSDDSASADSDPDGDALSVIEVDGKVAGGTVTLTSGATLTLLSGGTADYDPNGAFDYLDDGESATDSFDYVISDGNGGTDTAMVTVTVSGANDLLETTPDAGATGQDSPVTIDVLANDVDPDTSDMPLGVLAVTQPSRGSATNNGTNVTFDPESDFDYLAPGESATVSFTYTAQSQDGSTAVETVTVTVSGENDGPDTHEDTLHTMEGIGGSVDVIQNDSDPDSPQLTITEINGIAVMATESVALASGGFVSVMEDGRVYFNPNGDYSSLGYGETAIESFTYTAQDDGGATSVETVSVVIEGVDNKVQTGGAYQVLSNQLYEIVLDPTDESIEYVPIGAPLPFNFNSIAFNANDNLIYANTSGGDSALGVNEDDVIQINPFTGEIVGNLGQFTNDQNEPIPSYAGVINADINVYYVNGPADSGGNTAYAIDLDTYAVTPIGVLPGADFGVDVNTGLIWSVSETESYSLDPTSGVLSTFTHGGLQADGTSAAGGTYGSMFSDVDGNIQVTSNVGYGLYQLNTANGALTRIGDAPATNSNDATGTRTSALPSALPYLFLDIDGSTGAATNQDVFQVYDPDGPPVAIADSDLRIADLDGDTISSAKIVLKNSFGGDVLAVGGALPAGIVATSSSEGGLRVLTLTGDASQADYEAAILSLTFSNAAPGSTPTDPREISITLTDVEGVEGNTAKAFIFIGSGSSTISPRDVQTADQAYGDQMVVDEDDVDAVTGGATFNLIDNDSDNPMAITSVTQPPVNQGSVINHGNGTVTFRPGDDFQYLSVGETAVTSFTYTSDTGQTETVTVTVHGADDPVEALPDSEVVDADETVTIDVLANDSDVDTNDQPLTLTAVTQPAAGQVAIVGNQAVFDPQGDFDSLGDGETATVTFIYTVTNADGVDENELVTVTVNGVNRAPDAEDDLVNVFEDTSISIDVTGNDSDPDGDSLTVINAGTAANGTVAIDPGTGNLVYTPDPGYTGDDSFTYLVSDGEGGVDTATVNVTVHPTPPDTTGIWGGHFDLDYDTSLGGSTDGHDHAYDDDHDVLGVDYFNALGGTFQGVNDELAGGQRFKIILANGDLSPAARISINQAYDATDASTYTEVTAYDDIALSDLTVFSLGGVSGSTQLTSLSIMFPETAMAGAGFLPSQTGAVRGNTPGVGGEWRNGALTLQLVEVNADGSDGFTTDLSISSGGVQGVADSGLAYESTLFWHWDGPIYGADSPYVPGDPSSVAAYVEPVVIDLDGDGVEFRSVRKGIELDVDGDGVAERTAWANEDDAVLVYDENDNNEVDGRSEFAFADYSADPNATDLEGLRHFDTNEDLVLDANDAEFEAFKLWQDRDGDGSVDEDEMLTLTEAGIESIGLISDGDAYLAEGGDVKVHGEGTVKFADGTEGRLADAEFRYEELTDDSELQVVTDNGDIMDVNDSDITPEVAGQDLLEGAGEDTPAEGGNGFESGGAMPASSGDDDAAAADAAMS